MSEINKRFEIDVEETTQENALFKGDEFICYADDVETIIEKLNELNDENEELKSERDYYERKKCEYFNDWNLSHLDNIDLRKENEELKEEIKRLRRELKSALN